MKIDCDKIIFDDSDEIELLVNSIFRYIIQNPECNNREKLEHFCRLLIQVEFELPDSEPEADRVGENYGLF